MQADKKTLKIIANRKTEFPLTRTDDVNPARREKNSNCRNFRC